MFGGYCESLSSAEQSLLALEEASPPMHVGAVLELDAKTLMRPDGGLDIERIRGRTAARLHRASRSRQRLVRVSFEPTPVWADDPHFNLDYHVRHARVPPPGDAAQLKQLAAQIASQPLDQGKPMWELWLLEGLADGRAALVFKQHLCLLSEPGADLLAQLLDDDVDEGPVPEFRARPVPARPRLLIRWLRRHARAPIHAATAVLRPLRLASGLWLRPRAETPLGGAVGAYRWCDWVAVDLEAVRAAARAHDARLDDVVIAIAAGALRILFAARGVDPASIEVIALLATRLVPLPVGESDPAERLRKVRQRGRAPAESPPATNLRVATSLAAVARSGLGAGHSALPLAILRGPEAPLHLLGAPVERCHPLPALPEGQGLGIAAVGYDQLLCWGFCADPELVPDLPLFGDAIVAATNELRPPKEGA